MTAFKLSPSHVYLKCLSTQQFSLDFVFSLGKAESLMLSDLSQVQKSATILVNLYDVP